MKIKIKTVFCQVTSKMNLHIVVYIIHTDTESKLLHTIPKIA